MLWRSLGLGTTYELCSLISLPEGLLIPHDFDCPVYYIQQGSYKQVCYHGTTPMLNTNVNLVLNTFSEALPIVIRSWIKYTSPPNGGVFVYSFIPIVYSIAISAVTTWFLTIFVLTNYTIKPSFLLQLLTILSSVYMLILVIKSIVVLHNQQRQGYLHGPALMNAINDSLYLRIIDLIVVFSLLILQVQVVMRLFLRQSDKRLIFYLGTAASIVSQILWSISKFHKFKSDAEADKIVPALTYLVRIAIGMCYATIITAFLLTKIRQILANRHIWLISFLTLVFIYAPVAFFIADVSNTWVYALSEVFSVVTYVVGVVIPWEWCNKYNIIRKIMEKEGVLGRRFYEDELYELDRFELFVEEDTPDRSSFRDDDSDNDGTALRGLRGLGRHTASTNTLAKTSTDAHSQVIEQKPKSAIHGLADRFNAAKDKFLDITDKIIATGLAIPRSVSVGSTYIPTQNQFVERLAEAPLAQLQRHASDRRRSRERNLAGEGTSNLRVRTNSSTTRNVSFADTEHVGRNRRDVFVYSTRDVVLELDDNDDDDNDNYR